MIFRTIYCFIILIVYFIKTFAGPNNGSIEGIVVNERRLPISNVYIQIFPGNFSDVTDNNGHFIIENLIEDRYRIHLEHIAYQSMDFYDLKIKQSCVGN